MEASISVANGLKIKRRVQTVTIAAAATTDTTIKMPAKAIILGVTTLIKNDIPTATQMNVGDSGDADRFTQAMGVTAGDSDEGTRLCPYVPASELAVRLTPDQTPAAATGKAKVTIHFIELKAPRV